MAEYLSPGVFVEEFDSGVQPFEGVGTGTAGFIGVAERGPVKGLPQLITNFADFIRNYGGYLPANEFGNYRFLAYAVEHFFHNGGSLCFVMRVAPEDAACAEGILPAGDAPVLAIKAKNPGLWGNNLKVIISPQAKTISTCEFSMKVCYEDIEEYYDNLSLNIEAWNFVKKETAKSKLVSITYVGQEEEGMKSSFERLLEGQGSVEWAGFSGGSNGNVLGMRADDFIGADKGAGKRTGIQAFIDNDTVSIMAVPGVTDPKVQLSLVAHCESLASRFAVLDIPQNAKKIQDILNHRNIFDSTYAALYHPWLTVFSRLDKKYIQIPPSGSVIGIYARTDNTRGVHKAPANEVVSSCTGLDVQFNRGEQDILNSAGVNIIRSIPGQGIRVWGARTAGSDSSWKYINMRRLFIFIEESIKESTNWVVFEPNDEVLWSRVQKTIEVFLTNLWRNGALAGTSPEEAFFVNIGRSTMTQDDIDNGRLCGLVGAAPVKPAEFVIFRLNRKTAESQ